MTCLVAYDIEENKLRNKMALYLCKKGLRLQKSVFIVEIERYEFKRFLKELQQRAGKNDSVAVFRLCKGCKDNALQLNAIKIPVYVF